MFKKGVIYRLNESYNDSDAVYCVPVNTGDFWCCDCFLLDAEKKPLNGFEFPVVISKQQLGEALEVKEFSVGNINF